MCVSGFHVIELFFYQVEIIGDAYMVVAGVPDPITSHAERVANTGLAMLEVAEEVLCPYRYEGEDDTSYVKVCLFNSFATGNIL